MKNQSSAQLFVDGLATAQRRINIGAYGVAAGGIGGSSIPAWDGLAQANKSHDGLELQQAAFTATFAAGETHELDLRAYANSTDPLSVQFKWVPPDWQTQSIAAATAAASSAKKVVIFAFDDGTEGVDRGGNDQNLGLQLPGWQDALISAVAAVNPNVVVVLNTGDAVYMPWLGDVKSVLEMWYPGVAGGVATADVLTGAVNPSGKLPITFPDGSATRPRFPTDDPGCNPAAIVIPNNSTGTGANDGNCPLYPGTFLQRSGPRTAHLPDRGHVGERHLPGLQVVRQTRGRAALSLRARPLVLEVQLLEAQDRIGRRRWPGRCLPRPQHRRARRGRGAAGVRRPVRRATPTASSSHAERWGRSNGSPSTAATALT